MRAPALSALGPSLDRRARLLSVARISASGAEFSRFFTEVADGVADPGAFDYGAGRQTGLCLFPAEALGRSQAVRQRVLVPPSQVRSLAPQPAYFLCCGFGTQRDEQQRCVTPS